MSTYWKVVKKILEETHFLHKLEMTLAGHAYPPPPPGMPDPDYIIITNLDRELYQAILDRRETLKRILPTPEDRRIFFVALHHDGPYQSLDENFSPTLSAIVHEFRCIISRHLLETRAMIRLLENGGITVVPRWLCRMMKNE